MVKNLHANAGNTDLILTLGRSSEGGNGNHSSILAWIIPWTEEPSGLQSMGCKESDMTEHTCTHIGESYTHTHTHTHAQTYTQRENLCSWKFIVPFNSENKSHQRLLFYEDV